jgi:septum formation protein
MARIILASQSTTRITLLRNAGVDFATQSPELDERAVEASLVSAGAAPDKIALALAEAKAMGVADSGEACVIGADQTLDANGERWHKPATMEEARAQLLALSGRSHRLHAAVAGAYRGAVCWRHIDIAVLTMRPLTSDEIDAHLERVGEKALTSVGAYQIEGPGIQLFDRIEGDYFAILGLPLLPLLNWLREQGALER